MSLLSQHSPLDRLKPIGQPGTSRRLLGSLALQPAVDGQGALNVPVGWRRRDVEIRVPLATVEKMRERAAWWSVQRGGRFDAQEQAIFIYPEAIAGRGAGVHPVGACHFRPVVPTSPFAMIDVLSWDPAEDGTASLVMEAIELLAGQPLQQR